MLLSAEHLSINFGSRQLLDDVNFYLNEGDKVGVIGINGTGKSTFLKVLSGVTEPDGGTISRNPNVQVSLLPQNPAMEESATVLEQVFLHFPAEFRELNEYEAKTMLNRLGLSDFTQKVGTLSGGHKVYLTIDADLSRTAWEALDGRKGVAAVYNYQTGDILCMVSNPSFDPADPPEISDGDSDYEGVYLNRLLSGLYTPGSVFKVVTTAAALEKLPGVEERTFTCDGSVTIGDQVITCPYAHGEMDLSDAFARSCNGVYAQLAVELGADVLQDYARQAGLLEGFSVSGIPTVSGLFTAGSGGDLGWSGVGQYEDMVNPCAMLALMGSIASDDRAATPRLLYRETGVLGLPAAIPAKEKRAAVFTAETRQTLRDMMAHNVQETYGQSRFGDLAVCAKSGTAEVSDGAPHAWFVGFVDDNTLPLAFVVVVEHGGSGSDVAGSVAAQLLEQAQS